MVNAKDCQSPAVCNYISSSKQHGYISLSILPAPDVYLPISCQSHGVPTTSSNVSNSNFLKVQYLQVPQCGCTLPHIAVQQVLRCSRLIIRYSSSCNVPNVHIPDKQENWQRWINVRCVANAYGKDTMICAAATSSIVCCSNILYSIRNTAENSSTCSKKKQNKGERLIEGVHMTTKARFSTADNLAGLVNIYRNLVCSIAYH